MFYIRNKSLFKLNDKKLNRINTLPEIVIDLAPWELIQPVTFRGDFLSSLRLCFGVLLETRRGSGRVEREREGEQESEKESCAQHCNSWLDNIKCRLSS